MKRGKTSGFRTLHTKPQSMFDANGGAEKDVNNRVKIAWS